LLQGLNEAEGGRRPAFVKTFRCGQRGRLRLNGTERSGWSHGEALSARREAEVNSKCKGICARHTSRPAQESASQSLSSQPNCAGWRLEVESLKWEKRREWVQSETDGTNGTNLERVTNVGRLASLTSHWHWCPLGICAGDSYQKRGEPFEVVAISRRPVATTAPHRNCKALAVNNFCKPFRSHFGIHSGS
jgi:hypothetical protein